MECKWLKWPWSPHVLTYMLKVEVLKGCCSRWRCIIVYWFMLITWRVTTIHCVFLLAVSSSPSLWHGSLLNGLTAKDYRKALCLLPNISMLCMRIVCLCFSYHFPTFHRLGNSLFSNLPWNQQQFISLSRIHQIVIDRNNSRVAEFIRFILSDRHRFS